MTRRDKSGDFPLIKVGKSRDKSGDPDLIFHKQFVFAQGDVPVGWIVALIALLCSFLAGAFGAFIFGSLTITLKANQTVTGLAITMLGTGVANFFGELMGLRSGSGSGFVAVSNVTKSAFSSLSPDKVDSNRSPLFSIINRLFFLL